MNQQLVVHWLSISEHEKSNTFLIPIKFLIFVFWDQPFFFSNQIQFGGKMIKNIVEISC